ncbi:MAG: S8 family peptidase, partial [Thermomicrobiales bacterium]
MADGKRNFLLARGESLTTNIPAPGRVLEREAPYTLAEARDRLAPMLSDAVAAFDSLPPRACPNDETVASLILNPEYVAKSYYPEALLRAFELRAVGSHAARIKPEKRSKGRVPVEKPTTELYVAGSRRKFREMLNVLPSVAESGLAEMLPAVEQFAKIPARRKIKPIGGGPNNVVTLEVVLHASEAKSNGFILEGFQAYVKSLGLKVDMDRRLHAGSLCFLSLKAPQSLISEVAEFSFLRVVRQMPRLRLLEPILRGVTPSAGKAKLPAEAALDPQIRVAVFDGGLPPNSPIAPWVTHHEPSGIGRPLPRFVDHGLQVTSAVLFGHLDANAVAARPYAHVDHFRVLDEHSGNDADLHDVLRRIRDVLDTSPKYDFINISLGPSLSIDDDDVHAWTAMLDERLADGLAVATVAAGNNGESDAASGLNRVQVPGDAVNPLSIGACDRTGAGWARATYSAVGPGRSPGLVKPDLVAFGGSLAQPFITLTADGRLVGVCGTSFAAPYTLRTGLGVRAHFGSGLGALALQALMVHGAEVGNHPQHEVGWGKLPEHLDDI